MSKKIKRFSSFVREEGSPPGFPPSMQASPPTNIADGSKIAGLPPDLPPVPQRRNKSKIGRRKPPVA
jgi:hypothetical protein